MNEWRHIVSDKAGGVKEKERNEHSDGNGMANYRDLHDDKDDDECGWKQRPWMGSHCRWQLMVIVNSFATKQLVHFKEWVRKRDLQMKPTRCPSSRFHEKKKSLENYHKLNGRHVWRFFFFLLNRKEFQAQTWRLINIIKNDFQFSSKISSKESKKKNQLMLITKRSMYGVRWFWLHEWKQSSGIEDWWAPEA